VEGMSPCRARMFRKPMIISTFFTPAGQRSVQVLHVVQAQSSGRFRISEESEVMQFSRTRRLMFSGDLNLTGHPPEHVPHWIQRLRRHSSTSALVSIFIPCLLHPSSPTGDRRQEITLMEKRISPCPSFMPEVFLLRLLAPCQSVSGLLSPVFFRRPIPRLPLALDPG
jgi:hypothetical protein